MLFQVLMKLQPKKKLLFWNNSEAMPFKIFKNHPAGSGWFFVYGF